MTGRDGTTASAPRSPEGLTFAPGPAQAAISWFLDRGGLDILVQSGTRMEILGIGTDIIECPRIGKMIEQHGELFLRRVYTEREIRYCRRQACDRAFRRAMGGEGGDPQGDRDRLEPGDRLDRPGGPQRGGWSTPRSGLRGAKDIARQRGIGDILVSISHCRTYATAYALAVGSGQAARGKPYESPDRARAANEHPEAEGRGVSCAIGFT